MPTFEDHLAWTEPPIRPILQELRRRVAAIDRGIRENVTPKQRITYSVNRIFVEIKVQKKRLLVRVFDMGLPDPLGIARDIPASFGWQHEKELAVDSLALLDYVMPFIEASHRSALTTRVVAPFGRG